MTEAAKPYATIADIDSRPAGAEMDAMVVIKVLGLRIVTGPERVEVEGAVWFEDVRPYSTDDAAATAMLKRKAIDENWSLIVEMDCGQSPRYTVKLETNSSSSDSYPLAVCRAVLKAVLPA